MNVVMFEDRRHLIAEKIKTIGDDAILLSARLNVLSKAYRFGLITDSETVRNLVEIEFELENLKK